VHGCLRFVNGFFVMSDNRLAIGIDAGVTILKAGVVYRSHVVDYATPESPPDGAGPEEIVAVMTRMVQGLREKHPGVAALGVGMPGFVDFDKGIVRGLTHVRDWDSIPLKRILEEKTGLRAVVDNRANCMAVAEWKCGAARGLSDVVLINLETGVGGGVIANGRLLRGARHVAGEIGQTSIDWNGREGRFGNRGALERYLGSADIMADAHAAYAAAGIERSLHECSIEALATAALQGDEVARARWQEVGTMLATAVMGCCWLLNPQAVVVGGSITRAGELLFKPLREQLFAMLSEPFTEQLMVLPAAFGHDAGMIGAAALALEGCGV
jgi:glucokinase